jgi:hypothetical protein
MRCSDEIEDVFTSSIPLFEEFIISLVVRLGLHDFHKLREADVVRVRGLEPSPINTMVLDESGKSALMFNLRQEVTHDVPG